jgi:hypothetical protein
MGLEVEGDFVEVVVVVAVVVELNYFDINIVVAACIIDLNHFDCYFF